MEIRFKELPKRITKKHLLQDYWFYDKEAKDILLGFIYDEHEYSDNYLTLFIKYSHKLETESDIFITFDKDKLMYSKIILKEKI